MKLIILLLFAVISVCYARNETVNYNDKKAPKLWALLIAGSKGLINYRHQADIAHAYQLLRRRGVPAKQIVVLSYDDVPNAVGNPTKGRLFNKPTGPDVYKGFKIDYRDKHVTPEVFLAVLSGNKKAVRGKGTGRVIQSGHNDIVFVNYADHGGPGLLGFPETTLDAKTLLKTLNHLTEKRRYKSLLLYIEACFAGSMFDKILPQNTKILVSTASANDESSYAAYCNYKSYPCLGDLFSINWMEHVDKKIKDNENLFDQYQTVRSKTDQSHVELYGDFTVGVGKTKTFLGSHNKAAPNDFEDGKEYETVPTRDAALYYYKRMAEISHNKNEKAKYLEMAVDLLKKREFVDNTVKNIIETYTKIAGVTSNDIENKRKPLEEHMLDEYTRVHQHFSDKCFNLQQMLVFAIKSLDNRGTKLAIYVCMTIRMALILKDLQA